MHENLHDMIAEVTKDSKPASMEELDLSSAKKNDKTPTDTKKKEEEKTSRIGVISLYDWFEKNKEKFISHIKKVKVESKDVNQKRNLAFSVLVGKEGSSERDLFIIKPADQIKVLDLPGVGMNIYNNGFRILYDVGNSIILKAYGIKTGLIITYCLNVDGMLIPYASTKLKKKDPGLEIVEPNVQEIGRRLGLNTDLESAILLYKQLQKSDERIVSNMDLLKWFISRERGVVDINHFLLIDKVLMFVFAG
jgi:hypothetical protein